MWRCYGLRGLKTRNSYRPSVLTILGFMGYVPRNWYLQGIQNIVRDIVRLPCSFPHSRPLPGSCITIPVSNDHHRNRQKPPLRGTPEPIWNSLSSFVKALFGSYFGFDLPWNDKPIIMSRSSSQFTTGCFIVRGLSDCATAAQCLYHRSRV